MTTRHWYDEADLRKQQGDAPIPTTSFMAEIAPHVGNPTELAAVFQEALSTPEAEGITDDIDSLAMFFGQLGHESAGFTQTDESLNYSTTALMTVFGPHRISHSEAKRFGRNGTHPADQMAIANTVYGGEWGAKNLGNTHSNDGWNYRGRGYIQLTGRYNYEQMAERLYDLYGSAVWAYQNANNYTQPALAARAAVAYWIDRVPEGGDIKAVTKAINGGYNGLEDRTARYRRVWEAIAKRRWYT